MTLVISAAILEGMRIGLSVIHLKGGDGRCLTLDALDETTRLIYKADYFGPSVDAFIRLPDETMKGFLCRRKSILPVLFLLFRRACFRNRKASRFKKGGAIEEAME
jgi:hypothetical protein